MTEMLDRIFHWLGRRIVGAALAGVVLGGVAGMAFAETARELALIVTPSLARSELLRHLIPRFEKQYRMSVKIIERPDAKSALGLVGSGSADLLWLNDEVRERASVKQGLTIARRDVMFGELVLVGPKGDPAGVRGMTSLVDAARLIAAAEASFVSRGDTSAVHRVERGVWTEAKINLAAPTSESWYIVQQGGMGKALETAIEKKAYILSDRATWLRLANHADHVVLVSDDPRMILQFGVLLVNPTRGKTLNAAGARAFLNWLTSKKTQQKINGFSISGQYPFTANFGQRKTN
ncbi:MAG: substrate-binding domain-containing protein [Alphaproteobacteria bacterium]